MAKITRIVGARFEDKDPVIKNFESIMKDQSLNQSTLTKLVFKYALDENQEDFYNWIVDKTIIIK